jgi:uncharacterized damage-inducible protein DinB
VRRPLLADAFGHHVWATLTLLDVCSSLDAQQLATTVPGTYGSIIDTLRHLVGGDRGYLFVISRERVRLVDEEEMDVAALRRVMEENAELWPEVVSGDLDADADYVRPQDDGSLSHAPLGIRLAQVVHHGTDHRSQICTALTSLGIGPPLIDLWDYGIANGRTEEIPPPSP